jgi:glutaredoxin
MPKFLVLVVLLVCVFAVYHYFAAPPVLVSFSGEQIIALAGTVKAKEVTIYTSTTSPKCAEAKSWLQQHGFAFNECNTDTSTACERAFLQMGGSGTPFLVIKRHGKTHYMRSGFDSNEFLGTLGAL